MNSEKVKEIKKALECCKQNEIEDTCEYCSNCPASDWNYEKECKIDLFQKTLTLINELESENKELKKYKTDWLNSEKMHLQADMENTEFELASSNRIIEKVSKENQTLKDQIAELENLCNKTYEDLTKEIDRLEKENAKLANVTPYQVIVSDAKFEELKKNAIEDFNLTKIMLKQFAERLFEKYSYDKLTHETDEDIEIHLTASELDETLKEFEL